MKRWEIGLQGHDINVIFLGESMESIDLKGGRIHPRETIFPIFRIDEGNRYFLVGTGFFIADRGVFSTAKHVIQDFCDSNGVLKCDLVAIQFRGNKFVIRKIGGFALHPMADVAVGVLELMIIKDSGKYFANNWSAIGSKRPQKGDKLFTYCYPETIVSYEELQAINVIPTEYEGVVVEEYPDGRDGYMLPSTCYQVEMNIVGGASGGPVFDQNGLIVSLNSTSYEGEYITFVSCIQDILDLDPFINVHPSQRTGNNVRQLINQI